MSSTAAPKRIVVKTYGRGSLLGLLSVLFTWVMARRGMHGWQETAAREMEDDSVAMSRRGYRVIDSRELGIPRLGTVYYQVTYERAADSTSPA